MKDKHNALSGIIGWLLLFWLIANFGPYLLVYLLSGQPFYQALPFQQSVIVEVALMSLNLGLPLWWLWQRNIPWREGLAWQWQGRRSWLWGLGGLAIILIWGWLVTLLLPVSAADFGTGQSYPLSQAVLVLLGLVALWVTAVAGEEVMFRGWMQTQLERRSGTWLSILVPALLFGLRHLPLDLYQGHDGWMGWTARLLELYGLALLLGIIRWRTGSIASTAILHGILWWLVIFSFYGTAVSAIVGLILASSTFIYNVIKEKRAHGQGLREGSHEI